MCHLTGRLISMLSMPISINDMSPVHAVWTGMVMMTSSNGSIFCVTGPLCGEFTGPGEFPAQRLVTRSFDVFFDLRLNKRFSKQSWGWWFKTPPWSLWRHNVFIWLFIYRLYIHYAHPWHSTIMILIHMAWRNRFHILIDPTQRATHTIMHSAHARYVSCCAALLRADSKLGICGRR